MASNMSIYYQNVRGLRTKCVNLFNNVLNVNYDIILFTETWLQGDILDGELCDARYDVFRCDRNLGLRGKSTGGGVMILARKELEVDVLNEWSSDSAESLCVRVPAHSITSQSDLFIVLVYTPPYVSTDHQGFTNRIDNIINNISKLTDKHSNCNYLVTGDFNFPCIHWEKDECIILKQGKVDLQICAENFVDNLNFFGLKQYNQILNVKNRILDLCLGNFDLIVTRTQPLSKEDMYHPSILINTMDLKCKQFKEKQNSRFNFYKGNYELTNTYLSNINWADILSHDDINEDVSSFNNILHECWTLFIPLSKRSIARSRYPIWYSRDLIKLIERKNKIHKKWKRYNNPRDYDQFSLLRDRSKRVQDECFCEFTKNTEYNIRHAPKYFWTYVKSKRGGSSYPKYFTHGDNTFSEGQQICNAFNEFFKDAFNSSAHISSPSGQSTFNGNDTISQIRISKSAVEKHLNNLDKTKSAGCDGIPPIFLFNCAKSLALPISILFNKSLYQRVFPAIWKRAHIIPIYKKGSKTLINNYRPISILNTVAKIFEKIVYLNIYSIISRAIPTSQHGFLRGRSTVSNLAIFTDYVLCQMENGGQVDVIYTDFEKAFDRVDHLILLHKLESLGIHGDLLRWIKSYLSKRSQAVVLGGYRSNFISVPSGVPQGSHLGPLFYNAYLYDIHTSIRSANHLLYADDKKVFMRVNSVSDCTLIQQDLNYLYSYYVNNNITISTSKCQCISFTRKTKPILFTYKINETQLQRVESIRDLGVLLDSKLSFSDHVDNIIKRAYRNLGFVMRTCKPFTSITSLKIVYYAYVRSILEYACPIWAPIYDIYKNRIETIQRKFLRHLKYRFPCEVTTYEDICHEYNLLTLDERRTVLDMGLLYDVLSGRLDCPEILEQLALRVPGRRTRNAALFHVPFHSTNYGMNAVLTRIARCYNARFGEIDPFIGSKDSFLKNIRSVVQKNTHI